MYDPCRYQRALGVDATKARTDRCRMVGRTTGRNGYIKDIPSDNLQASIALLPAFVRLKRTRQNSPGTAL